MARSFNKILATGWRDQIRIGITTYLKPGCSGTVISTLELVSCSSSLIISALMFDSWIRVADQVAVNGAADEAAGYRLSAGTKYLRASGYYLAAERMQSRDYTPRWEAYAKGLELYHKGCALRGLHVEKVEIPYECSAYTAIFVHDGSGTPRPTLVSVNGLDSMKEQVNMAGHGLANLERGMNTLFVDQPGTGEALRLQGLPATPYSEEWASKAVDWLEQQPEVDAKKIGMTGISLGGHFAPRAVAYEPRFASGAAWGANHNWREVQDKRMAREGENPVPHYWGHVYWVFGAKDHADFLAKSNDMNLNGHLGRIKVPFLVTHGANDRQISVDYAHQAYAQLTNSPRAELKIFTPREGGVEHVGADNMAFGRDYIAGWFAETLGGKTA